MKKLTPKTKKISAIVIAIVLVGTVVSFMLLKHSGHTSSEIPVTEPASSQAASSSDGANSDTGTKPDSSQKTPSATPSTTDKTGAPAKPYGTFVSNHRPSLTNKNGVPADEESVCQGTPGATCSIVFTKGGATKSLPQKTLDSSGTASWDWNIVDAGFTQGSWQIKAISTLNGKTAEATDSLALEVQP